MHICTKCFLPYDFKHKNMSECNKCGGHSVDIDDILVAPIIELWRKGYKTIACCSGHSINTITYTNILFKKGIELPDVPKGYEKMMFREQIMICRYFYKNEQKEFITEHKKLKDGMKLTILERHIKILESIKSLTDWVIELPKIKLED